MMNEMLQYTVNGIAVLITIAGGWFIHQHIRPWLQEQIRVLKAARDQQEFQVLFDLAGKAVLRAQQTIEGNNEKKEWAVNWVEAQAADLGYRFEVDVIADAVEAMVYDLLKTTSSVLGADDINFVVQRNMELQRIINEMEPFYELGRRMSKANNQ
jgi:hypothetical protein